MIKLANFMELFEVETGQINFRMHLKNAGQYRLQQ